MHIALHSNATQKLQGLPPTHLSSGLSMFRVRAAASSMFSLQRAKPQTDTSSGSVNKKHAFEKGKRE